MIPDFQIAVSRPIITNHTSMESIFIQRIWINIKWGKNAHYVLCSRVTLMYKNEWPFWTVVCVCVCVCIYTLLFNIVNFCISIFSKNIMIFLRKVTQLCILPFVVEVANSLSCSWGTLKMVVCSNRPNKEGETPYNIDCTHQKSILTQIFGASEYFFKQTLFAQ